MNNKSSETESTVWIVNFSGHNYSDAERFGKLEKVTQGNISKSLFDRLAYEIAEKLSKSKSEDWLLISGPLVANIIACLVWKQKHKELRALVWDWSAGEESGGYRQLRFTDDHLEFLLRNVNEQAPNPEGNQPSS